MANTVYGLNPYINNYGYTNTQDLFSDLIMESIAMHGIMINYLPKGIINYSELFAEGSQYKFTDYFPMPAYQENYQNFGSAGAELMTKFGVFLNNTSTFYVARTHFENSLKGTLNIPREGDVIYVGDPWRNLMIITHVNHASNYFPHGKFQVYELQTELYSYDGADFDECGNTEIISELSNYPVSNTAYSEPADNDYLDNQSDSIIDRSESNPYGF